MENVHFHLNENEETAGKFNDSPWLLSKRHRAESSANSMCTKLLNCEMSKRSVKKQLWPKSFQRSSD